MRLPAHACPLAGAAWASWFRSLAQSRAKPLLKMPPGRSVPRPVSAMTDSGAIAARCGGCCRRGEELRDPRIRDPDHADLAVRDPGLRGDGLDDVVAVGRLERLEELERTARTTCPADVHTHCREAQRGGDQRARLRRRRIGGRVAGVLDNRRVRTLVGGTGQRHVHREQRAVARLQVAVAGSDVLRRVERRVGHVRGGRRRRPRVPTVPSPATR